MESVIVYKLYPRLSLTTTFTLCQTLSYLKTLNSAVIQWPTPGTKPRQLISPGQTKYFTLYTYSLFFHASSKRAMFGVFQSDIMLTCFILKCIFVSV